MGLQVLAACACSTRRKGFVSNKYFAPGTLSGLLAGALKGWGGWGDRLWKALQAFIAFDKSRLLLGCAKNHAKSKSRHKFFCPVWLQEQKPRQGNNFTKACLKGLLKSIAEYVLELLLVTETKKIDEIRYKKMRLYIF